MSEKLVIPAKTELIVLPADAHEKRTFGFVVHEWNGVPLHSILDGKIVKKPVPTTEDLVVGHDYAACGLSGYLLWTVGKDADGELHITCGPYLIGCLERGRDERNCWVVTGMINTRGLTKIKKAYST